MGEEGVKLDKWGYPVKTSSDDCISAINEYYHQVLSYGRKTSIILEAPIHDGHCVLGNVLAAHFLSSTEPSKASSFLQAAKSHHDEATTFEKAVFDAVSYLDSEDRDDDVAYELHAKLLRDFPRDLASLKRVQILCFYMGQPNLLLDVAQQVLPENEQESYFYGILAFALLELNRSKEAEEAARKGIEIKKQDYWAQHCLCHVLQYECRFDEAVKFMEGCSSSWSVCSSFMYTHNWWHISLCYVEGHSPIKRVLDLYDHHIIKELDKPDASRPEVSLNALALLLRLRIRGEISVSEDRVKTLATNLTDQTIWFSYWQLDIFISWALASTGRLLQAQELLEGLRFRLSNMNKKRQQKLQRGLMLAETLYEYGRGNDERALHLLGFSFDAYDCKEIGASNEQLDVFNELWYTLLLNTGNATKVVEVIEKQLKERDGAPFMWRLLEKAYLMLGRDEAASAAEKANLLEHTYFPAAE